MTIIIAVVFIVYQRKRIMKLKYKMLILIGILILSAVLSFAIMQKEKPDISGVWVSEYEIAIEFFDRGVWLSEEGFEGLGGEWKIQKDKIIMEDLYGNIFEGAFRQDEKGEYIILDGEAYYRERPSK